MKYYEALVIFLDSAKKNRLSELISVTDETSYNTKVGFD